MKINESIKEEVILGIDPGTVVMGYGIIRIINKKMHLDNMGVVKLDKFDSHELRLRKIFEKTTALIDEYKPDFLAIEAPFFGKNVQSMLKLGRAQGVAMAAALVRDIPLAEYSPKAIKKSITGNGSASKEQVAAMLASLLGFKDLPKHLDATDGLAAAVCHHFQNGSVKSSSGKKSGWDSFLKANPGRVSGL